MEVSLNSVESEDSWVFFFYVSWLSTIQHFISSPKAIFMYMFVVQSLKMSWKKLFTIVFSTYFL